MNRVSYSFYRARTIWTSFKELYKLPQEKVDAFVDSFEIYTHDWKDEAKLKKAYGEDYYKVVQQKICDWYSVLNYICALGSVEKMYIPTIVDSKKSLCENQKLFETQMMKDLRLKSGSNVLDIGCGRGRVAAHVAMESNSHVTGINIDDEQLKQAKLFAKRKKIEGKTNFQKADMNDIPFKFKDQEFDAIYHIQVFSLSRDLTRLLKELHRILKPGGRVSSCDWSTLDKYDPTNKEHVIMVEKIKPLLGAIGTPSKAEYIKAFEDAGFRVIKAEVPSVNKTDDLNIEKASKEFGFIHKVINVLVKVKILPKHFKTLLEQLSRNVDTFIEVDRMGLATTNLHIVAEKI